MSTSQYTIVTNLIRVGEGHEDKFKTAVHVHLHVEWSRKGTDTISGRVHKKNFFFFVNSSAIKIYS